MEQIKFKDLSFACKVAFLGGWFTAISFCVGVMFGFFGAI